MVRPAGLTDLHCHILPGLDDGAADMADSIVMAAQALEDGITVICATPHIHADHDVRIDELADRVEALNAELRRAEIAVTVMTGGELSEPMAHALDGDELRAVTLGGAGTWILVEPAPGPLSDSLIDAVSALRDRGVRSLIAHPERHAGPDVVERLQDLIARGALIQATAAHLTGGATAPVMLDWAERGLVNVLGSDAHSSRAGRRVALSSGLRSLAGVLAPAAVHRIAQGTPRAILGLTPRAFRPTGRHRR